MSTRNKLVFGCVALGLVLGASWMIGGDSDDAGGVVNQLWIDRMPRGERDMVRFFVAASIEGKRVGGAGKASAWRQASDRFMWAREDDRLSLYFGQDQVRWNPRVKMWKCKGEAPAGFELCLKMWDDRHTVLLYSRTEWRVDPAGDAAAQVPALLDALVPTERDVATGTSTGAPDTLRW